MQILEKILGTTSLSSFLERNFSQFPHSSAGGARDYCWLDWEKAQEVFQAGEADMRLVHEGKLVDAPLNFAEAIDQYMQGDTLLLRNAEKFSPLLRELALDFARSFHTPVDIQLYCTPEGHNAFGWHFDVEEVFIIQSVGSKEYKIRPNALHPHPLAGSMPKHVQFESEITPFEIQVTLQAGDWLYIPSGWWHVARSQTQSLHISVGLTPRSAHDILNYLPTYFASKSHWRTRLPVHKSFQDKQFEIAFYQEAFKNLGKDLTSSLSDPEFIQSFLKHVRTDTRTPSELKA